jgi:hypothetical protein
MDRFIEQVAAAAGRTPQIVRKRADELRAMLPPITAAYFCANMPHSNARLKQLGFELRYPRIEQGVASLDLKQRLS